jgi:hypothetical protein
VKKILKTHPQIKMAMMMLTKKLPVMLVKLKRLEFHQKT